MIRIEPITEQNFAQAVGVYTDAWRESHKEICTPEFLENRDYAGYLRKAIDGLYLISDEEPVGVFRLYGDLLSDLYIRPDRTGRGYGTTCIHYAMEQSRQVRLTVLSSNHRAIHLYQKLGFRFTGVDIPLKNQLWEREMIYTENHNG